jgi:nitrogen regulatory protein PII
VKDLNLLIAYVRPARRSAVVHALRDLDLAGWTQSDVIGHGHAVGGHGVEHVRFEIVVPVARVSECTKAITMAAHTGVSGDGLLFTLPVLSIERISTFSEG